MIADSPSPHDPSAAAIPAFLDGSAASRRSLGRAIGAAVNAIGHDLVGRDRPYSGHSPTALDELLGMELAPEQGTDIDAVMRRVGEQVIRNSVVVSHPWCVAHLHCPPLVVSCAAEVAIAATNQSMDSWDQAPAATHVEQRMIAWLARECGLDVCADGVFTSGGSQSNLMGLLLARDRAVARLGGSVAVDGLPASAGRFRIICSDATHFSILKAARVLGLGDVAVTAVPADREGRLTATAAESAADDLMSAGLRPIAIVGTAGTTDLGTIDPLDELAEVAQRLDAWFHVDAAVAGALLMSERERHRLTGLESADSVAVDFHKLWFQAIGCGAFLVADGADLEPIQLHADYLNPEPADSGWDPPNLVDKSLQTTRRFDALKLFVSLQVHGRRFFGRCVEATIDLAAEAAAIIERDPRLELAQRPTLNTVLLRYVPPDGGAETDVDQVNALIRRQLLLSGQAVVGQTRLQGRTWLKLTLMNPTTAREDIRRLLDLVATAGAAADHSAVAGADDGA